MKTEIFKNNPYFLEKSRQMKKRYYIRGNIHPKEETTVEEFKGHRSFCQEELPRISQVNQGFGPSRQCVSKYACGMLNTGKGGRISMGILDTGRIEGITLSKYQMDHIRLTIQDTLGNKKTHPYYVIKF